MQVEKMEQKTKELQAQNKTLEVFYFILIFTLLFYWVSFNARQGTMAHSWCMVKVLYLDQQQPSVLAGIAAMLLNSSVVSVVSK